MFNVRPVRTFSELLASIFDISVVGERRHATWFVPAADRLAQARRRLTADPALCPLASVPGGCLGPAEDGVAVVGRIASTASCSTAW
jgi:hypothetical protein